MSMAETARFSGPATETSWDEAALVARLRAGDESAFAALVAAHGSSMLRLARTMVPTAVAEEVVQEAWLGVMTGIHRFQSRSSLKTWIFRILTNTAKTRAAREARTIPFSSLASPEDDEGPSVDPSRFQTSGAYAGHWTAGPKSWDTIPEERLAAAETLDVIARSIDTLPPAQRAVITLRDVEGWDSAEVCEALELSEGNQRVLLHRARSRVRAALEQHLAEAG